MVSTTLDPPKVTVLPTRSYTHPLHTRKMKKGVSKSEPFDPEELSRRLESYRQEEKEARRRRRAQANDKKGEPPQYHHVPQCAAVSFARTATPESHKEKDIHKLSRQVVKSQQAPVAPRAPLARVRPSIRLVVEGQEMARLQLEATADRNQFQRTAALEEAAQADHKRNLNKPQQRDFGVISSEESPSNLGPPSGGDCSEWDPSRIERNGSLKKTYSLPHPNDRHDWAQRDACEGKDGQGLRDRMTPFSDIVRRLSGGKGRVSPKSAVEALGDPSVDDSGAEKASRRKSSFLSLPIFRKH